MSSKRKILIGVVVVLGIAAAAALSLANARDRGTEVRMAPVSRMDLVATVTASGNIRARQSVDISSDVAGRIVELVVEEGDPVEEGQLLLRLDPTQFRAAQGRAEAVLSQARAEVARQRASFQQADREYDRIRRLWARDSTLISRQQYDDAETQLEVARSLMEAAEHGVEQAQAALEEAEDRLAKTVIRAPTSGTVSRLNVELGETVVVGTMNNPGSLILTVSDLSVVEAVMEVDETDVPEIAVGDSASVRIDAYPDREFSGRVTKIGSSAIRPPEQFSGSGQTASIDFEVVITLDDPPPGIRTDLSASADVIVDTANDVLSVPIIALTVRERPDEEAEDAEDGDRDEEAEAGPAGSEEEGVFVVREGTVRFVPVEVGITGQEHFEIRSGVEEGDTVVSGPYQRIRELQDGDPVRRMDGGGEAPPGGGS